MARRVRYQLPPVRRRVVHPTAQALPSADVAGKSWPQLRREINQLGWRGLAQASLALLRYLEPDVRYQRLVFGEYRLWDPGTPGDTAGDDPLWVALIAELEAVRDTGRFARLPLPAAGAVFRRTTLFIHARLENIPDRALVAGNVLDTLLSAWAEIADGSEQQLEATLPFTRFRVRTAYHRAVIGLAALCARDNRIGRWVSGQRWVIGQWGADALEGREDDSYIWDDTHMYETIRPRRCINEAVQTLWRVFAGSRPFIGTLGTRQEDYDRLWRNIAAPGPQRHLDLELDAPPPLSTESSLLKILSHQPAESTLRSVLRYEVPAKARLAAATAAVRLVTPLVIRAYHELLDTGFSLNDDQRGLGLSAGPYDFQRLLDRLLEKRAGQYRARPLGLQDFERLFDATAEAIRTEQYLDRGEYNHERQVYVGPFVRRALTPRQRRLLLVVRAGARLMHYVIQVLEAPGTRMSQELLDRIVDEAYTVLVTLGRGSEHSAQLIWQAIENSLAFRGSHGIEYHKQ